MKRMMLAALAAALAIPALAQRPVTIKGSDTMVIMNARLAEAFMAKQPGNVIQVTGGGSGVGIAALINGTTDVAASSRPIKTSEKDKLKQRFQTLGVEIPIARDGLSIYVHASNPLSQLSIPQVRDIFMGRLTNWKQVGGKDAPIILYSRENSSGTYGYFRDYVLGGRDFSPRAQTLQGTAAVVNGVAHDVNGIGFGGAAFAKGLKVLAIKKDDQSPAASPTLETVRNGSYPLARYLYLYSRTKPAGTLKAFVDWATSPEGQAIVSKTGYFPLK
jgi:phosphate transport system substrate-binding protein